MHCRPNGWNCVLEELVHNPKIVHSVSEVLGCNNVVCLRVDLGGDEDGKSSALDEVVTTQGVAVHVAVGGSTNEKCTLELSGEILSKEVRMVLERQVK